MLKKIVFLLPIILIGCKTVPAIIDTPETDNIETKVIDSGKDLETTIDDIKVITDEAKETGEITKPNIIKVIEYVDKADSQVTELNKQIVELKESRDSDNKYHAEIIATFSAQVETLKTKVINRDTAIFILSGILALFIIYGIIKLNLPP